MKRFELSIKATYVPNWDLYAGIRELIQNARDAEIQLSAPMKVEFVYRQRDGKPVGAVVISNEGCTIPREALLIGHTTKAHDNRTIGQWGEGLNIGILALVRLGYDVKFRNGSESWQPLIVRSETYNADVLAFDIHKGNKAESRVQVEVLGVDEDQWNSIRQRFLFLTPPNNQDVIQCSAGKILLGDHHRGHVHVKGMFVCQDDRLQYGYDFNEADIDRDRRMISNIYGCAGQILAEAISDGRLQKEIYRMLHDSTCESQSLYSYMLNVAALDAVVENFYTQYGEEAIPVESDEQVNQLKSMGAKGVRVPYNLRNILFAKLGNAADNIAKLRANVRKNFMFDELNTRERYVLDQAISILRGALPRADLPTNLVDRIAVVEFRDVSHMGTYNPVTKTVGIARKELALVSSALQTLIQEAAHEADELYDVAYRKLTRYAFGWLLQKTPIGE